jgi:hypothetical protein
MFEKDQKISNQKKEMNQAIDKIMQGITYVNIILTAYSLNLHNQVLV